MNRITIYTIGFTKKNAQHFFTTLKNNNIKKVIDVRLNNNSQLSGFTKQNDLIYFLRKLCDCGYNHIPLLAPSKELLTHYKNKIIDWPQYVNKFKSLIQERQIEILLSISDLDNACFLCSESTSEKCHRRLVVEYLQEKLGDINIVHL